MKNELTGEIAGLGRQVAKGLRTRRRTWLPRAALVLVAALTFASGETRAQTRIALANQTHTTTVAVVLGKSEDVHTDQRLVDIAVGDPGVADVNPLTDHALSILGKKIGTTRVTVYGEDKKPVGIFDVEVAYDISRLAAEIAHLSGGGIKYRRSTAASCSAACRRMPSRSTRWS